MAFFIAITPMSESTNFTPLNDIGYSEIIRQISNSSVRHAQHNIIQGMGDDCSVVKISDELLIMNHTAVFTEGVDFDLSYHAFPYLAYKCIASAYSDFTAMNARAETLQIGLSVPNRLSYEMLQEFYQGINAACKEYEISLTGGDLNAGHNALCISLHLQGRSKSSEVVYRKGARVDDAICVSGDLGAAYAGLHILMREKKHWESQGRPDMTPQQMDLGDYEYVIKRQLVPKARMDVVDAFKAAKVKPSSMIDLSKGLLNDLKTLCDHSTRGAYIYQAALPIAIETRQVADELQEDVDKYALYGGEDYELLFTLPKDAAERFAKEFNDFAIIGRITEESAGIQLQKDDGTVLSFHTE